MPHLRRSLALIGAVAAGSGLAACGKSDDDNGVSTKDSGADTRSTETSTDTSSDSATTSTEASGSKPEGTRVEEARRALDTASRAVDGGRPFDLESDTYEGKDTWEIKVASGGSKETKVQVSADGRDVVHKDPSSSAGDDLDKEKRAKVDLRTALKTAGDKADGRALDEAEIDTDKSGNVVWEATFEDADGNEIGVRVDARNGKVLNVERDDS